jgi:peptide/nickel transport system ATP-binding protein
VGNLLEVRQLKATYRTNLGPASAVDGVSFTVAEGRSLGLIGESGCGKTTLGRAITRVMPRNMHIDEGQMLFRGQDLVRLSESQMRALRWRQISMIPQSSMDSLDPVYRLENQFLEVLCERGGMNRQAARVRAAELFAMVGLDPRRLRHYPHEFSGGMKQRAVIAMALALQPSLVIADEPVTALDVIVQGQVLDVIRDLQARLGISVIMITHDMSVVAQTCQDVVVMYAGNVVESGPVGTVFSVPAHPYTMGLTRAFPNLLDPRPLIAIEGHLPSLLNPPKGCRFASRCPFALEICRVDPPRYEELEPGHSVACHRKQEAVWMREQAQDAETWQKMSV